LVEKAMGYATSRVSESMCPAREWDKRLGSE